MTTKKPAATSSKSDAMVYRRIREILDSARDYTARSVNTTQVVAYWLIGREIVEEEQRGQARAEYGRRLIVRLSKRLQKDFGRGFSAQNLFFMRQFFQAYPALIPGGEKFYALRRKSTGHGAGDTASEKFYAPRRKSDVRRTAAPTATDAQFLVPIPAFEFARTAKSDHWRPGSLHPNLSWTHYRRLVRVEKDEARAFYEIEAVKNNWAARELERQIDSLLFERLAMSRDKKGLMRLATKGQVIQTPADIFKNPVVMEFLGLPESPRLTESDLESALISNLQGFLLELGKGFAFLARQERLTLDGDHFYVDLVFYHTILKCHVLIDLKVGKLAHADLGQLQLYVNYYDRERRTSGDGPTLGLILCTDKNDAVVRYMLGKKESKTIFARRYKLFLPTEAELAREIRREMRLIAPQEPVGSRKTSAKGVRSAKTPKPRTK